MKSPLWAIAAELEEEAIAIESFGGNAADTRRQAVDTAERALAEDRKEFCDFRSNKRGKLAMKNSVLAAQRLFLIGLTTTLAFAQSGDISGSTSNFTTLGATILKVFVGLVGMGFVGLLMWGGVTLTTNRPRGLAMIGGGLVGALLAGLAFILVNTLTGQSVAASGF